MGKTKNKFFGELEGLTKEETVEEVAVEETNEVEEANGNTIEEDKNVDTVAVPAFTHLALGLYIDGNGRYQVAKIKYDPLSGTADRVDNSLEACMDKTSAEEVFKMTVVREGVFNS